VPSWGLARNVLKYLLSIPNTWEYTQVHRRLDFVILWERVSVGGGRSDSVTRRVQSARMLITLVVNREIYQTVLIQRLHHRQQHQPCWRIGIGLGILQGPILLGLHQTVEVCCVGCWCRGGSFLVCLNRTFSPLVSHRRRTNHDFWLAVEIVFERGLEISSFWTRGSSWNWSRAVAWQTSSKVNQGKNRSTVEVISLWCFVSWCCTWFWIL
jgi:hypothetical protein